MKLTALESASKLLEYLIRRVPAVAGSLPMLSPDEGVGTDDTLRLYGDALAALRPNGDGR